MRVLGLDDSTTLEDFRIVLRDRCRFEQNFRLSRRARVLYMLKACVALLLRREWTGWEDAYDQDGPWSMGIAVGTLHVSTYSHYEFGPAGDVSELVVPRGLRGWAYTVREASWP